MKITQLITFIFTFSILSIISGCVNVEQKTTFYENGSGNIMLHYWTPSGHVSMGYIVGGMDFNDEDLKRKFSSEFFEAVEVKKESSTIDTTTHIRLNINFKDFNKISEVEGFQKVKGSYAKEGDNFIFKYIVKKDTTLPKLMPMDGYELEFKFEFPGEIISTNGALDGNSVTWNKTVADLKEDIVMTATIKPKSRLCGLFGLELPVIVFLGMIIIGLKRRK